MSDIKRFFSRLSMGTYIGGIIVLVVLIVALFAPVLAPNSYREQLAGKLLSPGTPGYVLGTDELGRCVASRIIYGARTSLLVGFISTSISAVAGVLLGIIAGYFGGVLDEIISRIIDIMRGIPVILLALVLVALFGAGMYTTMIALSLVWWTTYARLVRGQVLSLKNQEYVLAARALGASDTRILFKYVFPNIVPTIIITSSLTMGTAIVVESSLSFLGMGVRPPMPSWGGMLTNARTYIYRAPWLSALAGGVIALTVLGFNLLGDGINQSLDPKYVGRSRTNKKES